MANQDPEEQRPPSERIQDIYNALWRVDEAKLAVIEAIIDL